MEDFKREYFEMVRGKSGDVHAKNTLSVLNSASKFEEEFGVPLHLFDRNQMLTFFSSWGRIQSNTFEKKKMTVFWYLRWLKTHKGIDCDPEVTGARFSDVSDPGRSIALFESNTQLAAAFRAMFFDLYYGVPTNLRQGLCLILKTIGLRHGEIALLKRTDIDFENRIIYGSKKYEDVDPNILSLIKQGMEYDCFYDGYMFQHLIWSDLVIQPIRRRPTELTEVAVRGMVQRAAKHSQNTAFSEKSFLPNDLTHSYIFSKLYEYECSTGVRVKKEVSAAIDEKYWAEISRWTNIRLNSFRPCSAFVNEYLNWKQFYNKRV